VDENWIAVATEKSVRWINNSVTRTGKNMQFTY